MEEWRLQDNIFKFIRTWPIMVFIFIGSGLLAGFLVHFFPPLQGATAELYVGIDITRVYDVSSLASYAKTEPFNIDDYKNWQLSQVDAIASSELIANQALAELRNQDVYWEDVSTADFMDMQDIDWYDVGVWRIKIKAQEGKYSLQGVKAWRDVLVQELTRLILESEDVLEFEGILRATNLAITGLEIKLIEFDSLSEEIVILLEDLRAVDPETEVSGSAREDIWELIAGSSTEDVLWIQNLADFPASGQSTLTYIDWLDQVLILLTSEIENISKTIDVLESDLELMTVDYIREIDEAHGLSASLFIEDQAGDPILESYYPDSIVGIIGSFIGLFIYIILWVMVSEIRTERND